MMPDDLQLEIIASVSMNAETECTGALGKGKNILCIIMSRICEEGESNLPSAGELS